MKLVAFAFWLLALLAAPVAVLASDGANTIPDVSKGTSLYKQFCSHCHGINMVNSGASSFDLRKFPRDQKDRFVTSVTRGKGNMPAWGDILLPEEVENLWLYIVTRGGKEPPPARAAAPETPGKDDKEASLGTIKEGRLTACLPSNGGALSRRRHQGGAGLDYVLAQALASRLGLGLDVVWFESEPEEESDPVRETYALLSHRICDIVPDHPLYESNIGEPPSQRAAPPRWDTMPQYWTQAMQVDLEPIAATRPYRRAELAIVVSPKAGGRRIARLSDLEGLTVGVQQGTLGGVILTTQLPAAIRTQSVMLPPGPQFLWRMEQGMFDATLTDTGAYDSHRVQNRITRLELTGYRHPIGFNMGIAYRKSDAALGAHLDAALATMLESGEVEAIAAGEGVTWAPPRDPLIAPPLTTRDLFTMR
ncbi:MAG: c-type cytochrome [Zhengella sp.]|uniref:c-type cytochrome n=1 Tax=Zhengella sp. TaxID=2282762 RepID=UPI001DD32424|nr:c-type cytochrome [Notoacmeibacter sp.]MCC0027301.1 c-type cytochrome [Brucellaceae bacterium]